MVVEDDDDVARAIARKLGADGHEVELVERAASRARAAR